MNGREPADQPLNEDQWRPLLIFLSTLNDRDFATADDQLKHEMAARRERETNVLRLFYSSLTDEELQSVQHEIAFLSAPLRKGPTRSTSNRSCRPRSL